MTDDSSPGANSVVAAAAVSKSADNEAQKAKSARERRRKKKESESVTNSVELVNSQLSCLSVECGQPVVSKSYPVNSSGYPSHNRSTEVDEHSQDTQVHSSVVHSSSAPGNLNKLQLAPKPAVAQSPETDDNSSTGSSSEVDGNVKNIRKQRNDVDMKDLINMLCTTLQLPSKKTKPFESDVDVALPVAKKPLMNLGMTFNVASPSVLHVSECSGSAVDSVLEIDSSDEDEHPKCPVLESGISVTTGGRLMDRITILRKDCIHRLGVTKLKQAYDIIDGFRSEEVEPQLVELLGQNDFDEFAGKIYQLKFYEESAFGCGGD
jgi:hypothetical protein